MQEIYKKIPNYETYEVSNQGNVRSKNKILKPARQKTNNTTYLRVTLYKDGSPTRQSVHRLVAQAFIKNPCNLPVVNHLDNNATNNCVSNLEWATQSDNMKHAQSQGRLTAAQRKGGKVYSERASAKALEEALALVGNTVNNWDVLSYAGLQPVSTTHNRQLLNCRCAICEHTEQTVEKTQLLSGKSSGCRKCTMKIKFLTSVELFLSSKPVFNNWKLLGTYTGDTARTLKFDAACSVCATETTLQRTKVLSNIIKSCPTCKR